MHPFRRIRIAINMPILSTVQKNARKKWQQHGCCHKAGERISSDCSARLIRAGEALP
jgi:hypothetical protein